MNVNGRSFFDTNILVYMDDRDSGEKQKTARDLYAKCFSRRLVVVSTQVLQEYFAVATRKLGIDIETARRKTELYGQMNLMDIQLEDILGAIDLKRLHGFDFWDGLIVRKAIAAGCVRIFSEDFTHGRRFDSVEIVNPFQ